MAQREDLGVLGGRHKTPAAQGCVAVTASDVREWSQIAARVRGAPGASGLGEEVVDDGGEVGGFGHEGEVAAAVEVQSGVREGASEDPRVDGRDEWVVVGRQYECGLSDELEEGQAGPAADGEQL